MMKLSSAQHESIDRLTHAVEEGLERIQNTACEVEERLKREAQWAGDRTRRSIRTGRQATHEAAGFVAQNAREHPTAYIAAGVGLAVILVGLVILTSASDRGCCKK